MNQGFTGEQHAVLSQAALEGALAAPMQEGFGQVMYPTPIQRAAALLRGLATGHSFENANKRTAWLACMVYLDLEGIQLEWLSEQESGQYMLEVVNDHTGVADIALWLTDRLMD